jgi:hypothetical protein
VLHSSLPVEVNYQDEGWPRRLAIVSVFCLVRFSPRGFVLNLVLQSFLDFVSTKPMFDINAMYDCSYHPQMSFVCDSE